MNDEAVLDDAQKSQEPQAAPAPKGRSFFTKENARIYSEKGRIVRRANIEARLKAEADECKPPPTEPLEVRIALTELNRVSDALAGKLSPSDRCALLAAMDRLYERLRILRGQPKPGTNSARPPAPLPSPVARALELQPPVPTDTTSPVRDEQE